MDEIVDDSLVPDANGVLDLQDKHWVTLDDVVWSFGHALLVLNVSRNQLVVVPPEVGHLVLLRELLLSNNRLPALPSALGQCLQLRKLDLHRNRLTELPRELQHCERLEELDASWNELRTVPPELGRLQRLRVLNVRHNQLTSLPHTLCECAALEQLGCEGNAGLVDVPEALRGNTRLVLWICATVKTHRAAVDELVAINAELEHMARLGDEERLRLREDIARLQRDKAALEAERPHHYLRVKQHVLRATSQVCGLM